MSDGFELPEGFDSWRGEQQRAYIARLEWLLTARPEQLAPEGNWENWICLAGRGWGKTRTAAEDIAHYGRSTPDRRIGIIAATFGDARDTCVEGESGLLRCFGGADGPDVEVWNRSLGELVLKNGTRYRVFSADQPDRLRGPQHHRVWCDELAAWKQQEDVWAQMKLGLRLPPYPQVIVTTTPRPTKLIKLLVADSASIVTRGATFDNKANLAASTLRELQRLYGKTRMGRQELFAEILSGAEDAIIKPDWWQLWETEEYPEGDFTVASLDSAYTKDKLNDASVLTIWRVYGDPKAGLSRILLVHAWKRHVEFDELVRDCVASCKKYKVDRIYVEGKANGISVIQELRRRTREQKFVVHQVNPDGDKIARAHACAGVFSHGVVYAPGTKWAQMIIDDCAEFPDAGRDSMDSVSQAINQLRKLGLNFFKDEEDASSGGNGRSSTEALY